jgi:hypothetical protein
MMSARVFDPPHRSRRWAATCLVLAVAVIDPGVTHAGARDTTPATTLRLAVKPIEPFVFKQGTELDRGREPPDRPLTVARVGS